MPFEINVPLVGGTLTGAINSYITEIGGVNPVGILEASKDFEVHVEWTLDGTLTPFISGEWSIRVFMESIGTGPDLDLPATPLTIPLIPGVGPVSYAAVVTVPGGTVTPTNTIPYYLVATVTYVKPDGLPGPMAGFSEGPMIQFYVD
jgi:hypothetical protein